jgi:hypothetical protein
MALHGGILALILAVLGFVSCKPAEEASRTPSAAPVTTKATVQIVRRSPAPDPKRADYADCLYTAEVKVLDIREGRRLSNEILLVLPAFTKRELQPEAAFTAGQLLDVETIPDESASDKLRTMQRADAIDRFDLPVHFAVHAQPSTRSLEELAALHAAGAEEEKLAPKSSLVSSAAPVRYPWSARAAEDRRAAIAASREEILKAFRENGSDWAQWNGKIKPMYADLCDQKDANGSELFKGRLEYQELIRGSYDKVCNRGDADEPGPLMMLKSLNAQLRARGIDLIVVPFPTKEDVQSEEFSKLAPKDGWFEPSRQKFLLQLLDADIEVIDLIQPLRAARQRFPYVFYDDDDEHPADGGIQVAAEEISKRLARYDLTGQGTKPLHLHLEPAEVQKPTNRGPRTYPASRVCREDGTMVSIPENSGSPVIIMGDSYVRIPHQYLAGGDGCALPMHLAHKLGIVPDNLVRMGGSSQAMRLLAREGGNYLSNRRALVFVFAHTRLFGNVAKNMQYTGDDWDMINLPPLRLAP